MIVLSPVMGLRKLVGKVFFGEGGGIGVGYFEDVGDVI